MTLDATEAARALAARRPRATYTCAECHQPFEAVARGGQKAPRLCKRCRRNVDMRNYRQRLREKQA